MHPIRTPPSRKTRNPNAVAVTKGAQICAKGEGMGMGANAFAEMCAQHAT